MIEGSPWVSERHRTAINNCGPVLTATQADILADLTRGMTAKQIAYARKIKLRTVSQHIADARARLGAETRDQAIALYVLQYGMTGA